MKMSLKDLGAKKMIETKKGDGYYKPTADYLVMYDETIIAFITYDAMNGEWRAEDAGGSDYVRVKAEKKAFDVYKKLT